MVGDVGGSCSPCGRHDRIIAIRAAPVAVERSNDEWQLWWVPLRHIGGLPHQYFDVAIAIDSRACVAVVQKE
jgi:hypothetical protein